MPDTEDDRYLTYVTLDGILALHAELFGLSLTEAADRLLNRGALESALARPRHYAAYEGADLASQAAVLAQGVALDHPFIDGNKRTAFLVLLAFLDLNGWQLQAPDAVIAAWIIRLVEGAPVNDFAAWLRGQQR